MASVVVWSSLMEALVASVQVKSVIAATRIMSVHN